MTLWTLMKDVLAIKQYQLAKFHFYPLFPSSIALSAPGSVVLVPKRRASRRSFARKRLVHRRRLAALVKWQRKEKTIVDAWSSTAWTEASRTNARTATQHSAINARNACWLRTSNALKRGSKLASLKVLDLEWLFFQCLSFFWDTVC